MPSIAGGPLLKRHQPLPRSAPTSTPLGHAYPVQEVGGRLGALAPHEAYATEFVANPLVNPLPRIRDQKLIE
jgi:hypothetical protein